MQDRMINTHPTSQSRKKAQRALVACGLWLRLGFIGACGLGAGLHQLLDGEVKPLSALALAVGGGALAAISWWRGRTVLDAVDGAAAVTARGSSPANAGASSPASAGVAAGT